MKGHDGLLAGAARLLSDNVEYIIGKKLASLSTAWYMASAGPGLLIGYKKLNLVADNYRDMVVFNVINGRIVISSVIKQGVTVWSQG
jgi:N-acetylglucosamine-6-phosphate deacetylase